MIRFVLVALALVFGGAFLEHEVFRPLAITALIFAPVPAYLLGLSQHRRLRRLQQLDNGDIVIDD